MPTNFRYLASTLVSTVAVAALGCGGLDGHTGTRGTLATVQGALVDPSGYPVHNDVRVAVVWLNINGLGYIVSEDLPVQPVFPSSFVVQLDGPPPAAAISVPRGIDEPVAVGVVVAYEDLNGNGKLDLVPSNAGAFIDRIVGANENLYLFYIDGPVPLPGTQSFVGTATPGYNLVQTTSCQTPVSGPSSGGGSSSTGSSSGGPSSGGSSSSGGPSSFGSSSSGGPSSGGSSSSGSSSGGPSGGAGSSSSTGSGSSGSGSGSTTGNDGGATPPPDAPILCTPPPPQWLPMTTPYNLTVSSDPKINQIMCQNGGASDQPSSGMGTGTFWTVSTQGTPPGGYPSRTDPGLTCHGSTSYFYQQCMMVQDGVCGPSITNCTSIYVDLGAASPPPGWPCP
jgi:hypothetical protein